MLECRCSLECVFLCHTAKRLKTVPKCGWAIRSKVPIGGDNYAGERETSNVHCNRFADDQAQRLYQGCKLSLQHFTHSLLRFPFTGGNDVLKVRGFRVTDARMLCDWSSMFAFRVCCLHVRCGRRRLELVTLVFLLLTYELKIAGSASRA